MPRIHFARAFAVLAALVFVCHAPAVLAEPDANIFEGVGTFDGATSQFDVSARAAGMGGAATAAPWGDVDYWSNPALLGDVRVVRYVHGRTPWTNLFGGDVTFTTDAVQAGARGLGVVLSGEPFDAGGATMDAGTLTISGLGEDEVWRLRNRVRSFGAGVSVLQALGNAAPSLARWSRVADVSLGYAWKRSAFDGFGDDFTLRTHDWGALARVTPVDGFRDGGRPLAIALAAGRSDINAGGRGRLSASARGVVDVVRQRRTGVAARVAAGRGPALPLFGAQSPLVTVVAAYDHADLGAGNAVFSRTDGGGVEWTLMGVVTLRTGHTSTTSGTKGATFGWGLALPLGAFGGVAYDEARFPQQGGLEDLHRRQFSVWLDPFAAWRASRGRDN